MWREGQVVVCMLRLKVKLELRGRWACDRIWLLSSFMRASHRAGRGKRVEDR